MSGENFRIPIENFIIERGTRDGDKVTYFDPQGHRHHLVLQPEQINAALRKIDGFPKAIHRSSGGIINAQPTQLILYHSPSAKGQAQLRVKVRFRDFRPVEGSPTLSGEFVSMTKIVAPQEIVDPFSYQIENSQRYVLDFGKGTIPIFVFAYISTPEGENTALFVDRATLESAISGKAGKCAIQRYKVPRDALRLAADGSVLMTEWDLARKNSRLWKSQQDRIPNSLFAGPLLEMRSGISLEDAKLWLRNSVHRWTRQEAEDYSVVEHVVGEDACITSDVLMYMEPA